MNILKVRIVGYGWVGKAMHQLFPDASIHDPILGYESTDKADIAFICVPTPNLKSGALDGSIVEQAVAEAKEDFIIIRSTVMPGTTDMLMQKYGKNIVFQPEYLGETTNHPFTDQHARPFMILGGQVDDTFKAVQIYQHAYNANVKIRQCTALEAEVIKLSENRAIAFKVAQCQELYDACMAAGVNYYTVRDAVYGDDPRFNLWWTFVFPDARGFNSKCIPKDIYGWAAWAESNGYNPELTLTMLKINDGLINHNSK